MGQIWSEIKIKVSRDRMISVMLWASFVDIFLRTIGALTLSTWRVKDINKRFLTSYIAASEKYSKIYHTCQSMLYKPTTFSQANRRIVQSLLSRLTMEVRRGNGCKDQQGMMVYTMKYESCRSSCSSCRWQKPVFQMTERKYNKERGGYRREGEREAFVI